MLPGCGYPCTNAALYPSREVIANYWRLVETHRATVLSGVPAALANVLLDGADISTLRH